MTLEAFQGAIVMILFGGLTCIAACAVLLRSTKGGHQPSSAGERPDPPRGGSGVQAALDQSARIARLRAELADLTFAAPMAGPQIRQAANRLDELSAEKGDRALADHIRTLSLAHEDALKNARDTLEATKPPPPADWAGI